MEEGHAYAFESWDIGPDEHHQELYVQIRDRVYDWDTLICERFDYRPHLDKAELISREYIGVCKLARPGVVLQTPGQAKDLVTDDRLKRLGLYQGLSEHRRDAFRHLLFYLVTKRKIKEGIVDKWLRNSG